MSSDDPRVLIAGGGPVGLLCAWILGRRGIGVRLFDNNARLQTDPRAATTHPATLDLLEEGGLADDMARVGLVAPIFQFWDRPSNRLVAEFDHAILSKDTRHPFVVQCEQFKTARLLLDRIEKLPNVEVLFNHEVMDVNHTADAVSVDVRSTQTTSKHTGEYLIGADGGRSIVRKRSEIPFEGFTWPERFIVLTTPFDFETHRGYSYRSYFAEPGAWCNCFKVSADGPPGLWRTVFPTEPAQDDASLMSDAGVQNRLQRFFPDERPYEIVHRNLYVTHQRVAATFRKGRVLLAGDAAHVNNPIGGMGLNGGIQDAVNLADKLSEVLLEGKSDRLLDLYNLQRRTVAIEFVQEQSIANKKRLEESDPATRQRNLDELSRIAENPDRARQFLLRTAMIASQQRVSAMTLN
ncbi:MAG: FAD-dependent monooxygenase [Xanthobacteraceae bacterium]|nr:FAD-dependent monooxygenase [Xanthobacteraceae bacterium]MBV9630371.1 FAD-dependent monooxygenase [Xanthobacteraceae bacterium]